MSELARQRCFHHPGREAAARCPSCGRYFCRECVTEHDDRVLCAQCLAKAGRKGLLRGRRLGGLARTLWLGIGVWLTWIFFYYLGRILLEIPSEFHEGGLWKGGGL